MNIETEPKVKIVVNKDKVKVKKSNPLKGAIIDVDTETGMKEVFGEEPVDLFAERYEADTEDEQDLFQELKKNDEEDMDDLRKLQELEDAEELIRQQKQELIMKREMKKNANKYKSHIIDMLKEDIKCNEDAIKKHQDENLRFQQHLNELETIIDNEKIMDYLADNFNDEVNELVEEDMPKQVKAKKQKKTIVYDETPKQKGTRTFIDRKVYPNYLKHKMVFRASGNHKTDKERGKITMEVVFNAETKKFYNKTTKTEYDLLQDANRVWCNARGYDKLGNAWEDFKALDLKTNKTKSIEFLHLDNWIEKEDVSNYIQDVWNF